MMLETGGSAGDQPGCIQLGWVGQSHSVSGAGWEAKCGKAQRIRVGTACRGTAFSFEPSPWLTPTEAVH